MSGLPSYDDALARALSLVSPTTEFDRVDHTEAAGRVLRAAITADRDLPPFNRAQMDGYALRHRDLGVGPLPVAGTVPAGAHRDEPIAPGSCVKIATGAPVPDDVDTVVQHERTDRGDPVTIEATDIEAGHAIHPRGADARKGDTLVAAGTLLGAQHVALAASVGAVELSVARRPRTIIITTGDEVLPPDADIAPHQIRNSNAPLLSIVLERFGASVERTVHLADDRGATLSAVADALATADLIITVGGVSAGERDFLPDALDHAGVERGVAGAAIQPGKPVVVGRAPTGCLAVSLPGNPVSALACAHLFAWPIVRAWMGIDAPMPWRTVTLAEAVRPNPRRQAFRPARVVDDGTRVVVPTWAGSGDLAHTAATDGLARLPLQGEPVTEGSTLEFLAWA